MCFPNISQIQRGGVRNQERNETQLHTVRGSKTVKALGFSRFFFVSYWLYGESWCLGSFSEF